MGIIQSVFCSITFCVERVLTWTCCAFLLMLLMFTLVLLMVYGISVGYHYAQKELSTFALSSRSTEPALVMRRSGDEEYQPVVRLLAVNQSEAENPKQPVLEEYRTDRPSENVYMETTQTPVILLETERPPNMPELSPHEKEFAKRLIGRIRRSKNNTENAPFLRPLRNASEALRFTSSHFH